jgi:amino acid transporter
MGREGVLPRAFGRTHPRFKTPVIATTAVTVLSIVMALVMGYPLSDHNFGQPLSNYYFWATTGTLLVIVVYIMICLGGIVYFWNTRASRNWNPLVHVGIPVVGAIVFGAALYGSIHPAPPGILKWTPYVALVWLVLGIGVLLWLRVTRPDRVAQIGSILGEEGGVEAAVLDTA